MIKSITDDISRRSTEYSQKDLSSDEVSSLITVFAEDIVRFSEFFCRDKVLGPVPPFHKDMYGMALSSDRVVIAAPRGFSKSVLLARIYPLWLACYGFRKDIMIISASEGLAIENLRYVKQSLEGDVLLRRFYGDMVSEKWRENHIELKRPDGSVVVLRAKGAGGQIRGFRPDCVIIDDLETDDSVASEDQRKKLKDWVFKACLNCLLPGGQMVVIGTILSQLSLMQDLLEMDNGWVKKKYKAYLDGDMSEGKELWPGARPHSWLQTRKAEIGSSRFSAEYMNDPLSDENAPIREEHIKEWSELPNNLSAVIALDPAYSDEESSDYKVAVMVGVDANMTRYLMHYIRTHRPVGEYMQSVLTLWQSYRDIITGIGVPSSGIEKEFFRSFVNKASDMKLYPPFIEMSNTFTTASGSKARSKKDRIVAALQPLFENGKYLIGKDHFEAREELLTIGNSRWDDLVDAMAYSEKIITPVYFDSNPVYNKGEDLLGGLASATGSYGLEY